MGIPVIVAGMLFSCKNDLKEIEALTQESDLPVQTTFNARYDYTEKGILKNRLIASRIDRYEGENARLEVSGGLNLLVYDSLGQLEAELSSNRGLFIEELRFMQASEDVILKNTKGEQLNTEELIWYQDSAKIVTDKFVQITRADGVLFGKGLESDDRFQSYTIKQITGDLYLKEDSTAKESQ
jgi:LPS export ABC transporter protein LptC